METIKTGSDFSGVGAFDYAIERVCTVKGLNHKRIFACDMDKYARKTYIHNHGEPEYYPENVYERTIPGQPLDVYMTSPPCQAFSLAGNRAGKDDERGILFFNSYEFIKNNNPRFFIFENVAGLLSDDGGKTFQEWLNLLGGKSVNGLPVLFPYEDSVPYHIYWQKLNSKRHGIPQNRERVFIVGIRDDEDNFFRFPKEEHLTKRLKDVLEEVVDEKYNLSERALKYLIRSNDTNEKTGRNFGAKFTEGDDICSTIDARYSAVRNAGETYILGYTRSRETGKVEKRHINNVANTIHSVTGGGGNTDQFVLQIKTNNKKGHELANLKYEKEINESINNDVCTTIDASYYKGFGVRSGKCRQVVKEENIIRRLTPRECFRLMDFPDEFDFSVVSDTQAYKQAGNSIVIRVLEKLIFNLNL
jgi:DNA (cytosine-5)-methyltransferase 1